MRRFAVSVAVLALLLSAAAPAAASPAQPLAGLQASAAAAPEPGSIDLLFMDGPTGEALTRGRAFTIVSPGEGVLYGGASPYTAEPGAGVSFQVTPTNPQDGFTWFVEFGAPSGEVLSPGTYIANDDPYLGGDLAYFRLWGNSTGCDSTASSFRILEAAFDADGVPTTFAAEFSQTCGDTLRGEIRYHSTIDVRARDLTPTGSEVEGTPVGSTSAPVNFQITNTGTIDIHPLPPTTTGAVAVMGTTCGSALAPGSSCVVQASLAPTTGGLQESGAIAIRDDTILGSHSVWIRGDGVWPTVTTLVSTKNPNVSPGGTDLIATITPAPNRLGLVDYFVDGVRLGSAVSSTAGVARFGSYSPMTGPHTITAKFKGLQFYAPSTSAPIVQDTQQRVLVDFWATPVAAPAGHPIAIGFELDALAPITGGTVTIRDLLTNQIVATVAEPGPDFIECLDGLSAGTHVLQATYSGHGPDLPDTQTVEVVVRPGDVVLGRPTDQVLPPGPAWCTSLRAIGGVTLTKDPLIDLEVQAVGANPFTLVRMSNDPTLGGDGLLVHAKEFPYGSPISWSLIDSATGGIDADRDVDVSWQVKSDYGDWSTPFTSMFRLDRTAPVVSIPGIGIRAGGGFAATAQVPVRLSWTGSDAFSGIARFEVARQVDGDPWTVLSSDVAGGALDRTVAPGHRYRFRIRGVDVAGNVGAWRTVGPWMVSETSDAAPAVVFGGRWSAATAANATGGVIHRTSQAGASATFTVTGQSFGWLAPKGPTFGAAKVYIDGVLTATIDLGNAKSLARQLVFAHSWATPGVHQIQIVNLATTDRPTISVDGFVTLDSRPFGRVVTGR